MTTKLIHITDLYHPHGDPDDHYDLAQVFAHAKLGDLEIAQVIIDHSQRDYTEAPALCAVYQLNRLTNQNVHVTMGADTSLFAGKPELWKTAPKNQVWAAEEIIRILNESDEKVYITVVGGCLDTAIALSRAPEVFHEKCAGIVLNAGSSLNEENIREYNVALGHTEYYHIFQAPCPIYWNPCMNSLINGTPETFRGQNATYYRFLQKDIFAHISDGLLNYFLYMLKQSPNPRFLKALEETPDPKDVEYFGNLYRQMWCTACIFDLAGKTVTTDGTIVNKDETDSPVFEYKPIQLTCKPDGETIWTFDETSNNRFIFHINEQNKYEAAMTKALAALLKEI